MTKIRMLIAVTIAFAAITLSYSAAAFADQDAQKECERSDAVFYPHPSYAKNKYNWSINVKQLDCTPPDCPSASVNLNMKDKKTGRLLSTVKMKYGCGGGSIEDCVIGLTNKIDDNQKTFDTRRFEFLSLNQDLSKSLLLPPATPYALIIPSINVSFHFVHWDKFSGRIEYFTKDETAPGANTPEIWIRHECLDQQ